MKKSVAYNLAQIAVVSSHVLSPEAKVNIRKYLIEDEELAAFVEKQEAEEAAVDAE